MVKQTKVLYEFGFFSLDQAERLLLRGSDPVPLTPKAFDLLSVLVENRGRLLEKEDLMQAVWKDSFVEEGNLSFNISALRKALGEDPKERQYIETVPKRGYRFVAEVKIVETENDNNEIKRRNEFQENFENKTSELTNKAEQPEFNQLDIALENNSEKGANTQNSSSFVIPETESGTDGKNYLKIIFVSALFITVSAIAFMAYKLISQPSSIASTKLSSPVKITRLSTARNATEAAISPDGKYVVYVAKEARQQSLWLRQVEINNDTLLIPPNEANYLDVSFSADGNFVYYFKAESNNPAALYQIPTVGGTPRKITGQAPGPALSPDGKQFAFTRQTTDGETALSIANIDGSGERDLVVRKQPEFLHSASWSPDGKSIACIAGTITDNGRQLSLIKLNLDDKTETVIASPPWKFVDRISWLPDRSGLIATVSDYSFGPYQLWHVSYPNGTVDQVTNDLNNYNGISLTADSKTLVTIQSDIRPFIWVMQDKDSANAKQITSGSGTRNDYWGFSWTPNGEIVYVSTASGNQDIWIMNSVGGNQRQLTFDGKSDFDPSVSPDGRHIVFASERTGKTKIWQMDINGENLKQLTFGGTSDYLPNYTADGNAVVYTSNDSINQSLWKTSLASNNPPVRLTSYNAAWAAISPDGSLIACWTVNKNTGFEELAVVSINGGDPVKSFRISPAAKTWADIRWTPDGKSLIYIDTIGAVGNLWIQPLNESAPQQLTDFKAEQLFRFAFSPDGKQLTYSRGIETNDVVRINNFR